MKRKLLFLVSLLSFSMVLTACGDIGGGEGGDGGDSSDNSGASGINLPGSAEEALNKFYQLGQQRGFEVTFATTNDEGQRENETIGFKSDVLWVKEDVAYKKDGTNLELYNYSSANQYYEFQRAIPESDQYSLNSLLKGVSGMFYMGYEYASNPQAGLITAERDVTFLGRSAKEYTFAYRGLEGQADVKLVFDVETGITLKVSGSASVSGEGSSSSSYEITSFAIGNAVTMPRLVKNGGGQGGEGQGGEGQGGEGQGGETVTDVFSNKLLMYVSNQGASGYANSQLGLFADGKFELKFMQNGYQVVIFGSYTVAASKASATLTLERVYKDEGKQTNTMSGTWTLTYSSGAYALQVSTSGVVNFMAAGGEPSHYVIPGQGGGDTDVENFVNHMFTYVSQQNAPDFVNSTIALFDNGTFEVVTTQNGSLKVYLGNYTVNTSDTAATLSVTKYYSAASGQYVTQAVGNWLLTLQQNNYMLSMAGGPTVYYVLSANAPVHADIPEEGQGGQSGDDAKYQVTETQWNEMVYNLNYLTLTSNLSVEANSSSAEEGTMKLAIDNGKIREEGSYGVYYYEFTSLTEGTYYRQSNGNWISEPAPITFDTFNGYIGLLPVPFEKVSFNSITKCYGVSEWKNEEFNDTYWNFRVYFENGKITKVSYEHPSSFGTGRTSYEFVLYGYGQARVTLPEVSGGQGGDTNAKYKITAEQYNAMIVDGGLVSSKSNFTAIVTSSDNQKGYTMYKFDGGYIQVVTVDPDGTSSEYYNEFTSDSSGYKYYKDPSTGKWTRIEDTFGIGSYYNSLGILPVEFSQLTFDESAHDYVTRTWTNQYGDAYSNIHYSFEDGNLMGLSYVGKYAARAVVFTSYGSTSVKLPEIGSGGEGGEGGEGGQTQSKWPAEDIAAKLAELELDVTVPAPSVEDECISSVTDEYTDDYNGLFITITLTDANYAAVVFSSLVGGFSAFTLDPLASDTESGVYVFFNTERDIRITMTYVRGNPVVTLLIEWYEAENENTYPAEDIAAFIEANEYTTPFPSFEMDNVSYEFDYDEESPYASLFMTPTGENTSDAIIAYAETALFNAGFKVAYVPSFSGEGGLMGAFIDPEMQYFMYLMVLEDGTVYATICPGGEEMQAAIDFTYPAEKIAALTPEDLDDALPSFEQRGAVYQVNEDTDNTFMLWISPQQGMSANNIVANIQRTLTGAEYTPIEGEEGGYVSKNGQIEVYVSVIDEKMVEVYVYFPDGEEPPIEEPVEVTYTLVWDKGDWKDDITSAGAQIYAYVWGGEEGDQWIRLKPQVAEDGTISFELNITSDYTGVKIVRFSPNSELGWQDDEGVEIWNQSEDYDLDGKGGEIHFVVA